MLLIGEDPRKHISSFSADFQRSFLTLLRTAHGEKKVHINHFYQEYISDKEHVHMNATRWPSLTEFAKHLGREGLCRVEENEKGLHIAWIDNSPEALRRQDAIRKKERMDRGDEEREQKLIREQIERAEMEKGAGEEDEERGKELRREEGEKIKLSFGKAKEEKSTSPSAETGELVDSYSTDAVSAKEEKAPTTPSTESTTQPPPEKVSLKMGSVSKPKNVFAAAKKNALSSSKAVAKPAATKPMSEAERIMKEEIERKRVREANGFAGGLNAKRQRVS